MHIAWGRYTSETAGFAQRFGTLSQCFASCLCDICMHNLYANVHVYVAYVYVLYGAGKNDGLFDAIDGANLWIVPQTISAAEKYLH